MAQRIEEFEILVPAGNDFNNPSVFPLAFTQGIVEGFNLKIPQGHHGITGLQVWFADIQVIPHTLGSYATGNNRAIRYDTKNYPTGESWVAIAYNNDLIDHTFHLFVNVDELGGPADYPPVILLPYPLGEQAGVLGEP